MLEVCCYNDGFTILGHANYAEHGKDIVCAAVSTLLQTFIASVEELTEDKIKTELTAGYAAIEYKSLSERSQVLLDSFFLGMGMVADQYHDHVKVTRRGGR